MAHATQRFKIKSTHKPSVRFDPDKNEKYPLSQSFYLNRECAEKKMGCDDLDSAKEIEITVRIVK